MSYQGPDSPSQSSDTVMICPWWSGHTIRVRMSHWGLDVPPWCRCPFVIHPCCHRPSLLSSHALAITTLPFSCEPALAPSSSCGPPTPLCHRTHPAVLGKPRCAAAVQLWPRHPAATLQPTHAITIQLCHHHHAAQGGSSRYHTGHRAPHPRFTPHPFFARRPPHGAGTLLRAPSPLPSPDAGEGHLPRAHRHPGTGEPREGHFGWVRGSLAWGWGALMLPSTPGKTHGETPKSRPKPKCGRYRREKQPGGE